MKIFENYFNAIKSEQLSNITEYSYRIHLYNLLIEFTKQKKLNINILHEPKREGRFGSPDFKISTSGQIIGYIENKSITEDLNKTLKSDQLKKYQQISDNILLTNYIEWIWIKEGEIKKRCHLCYISDLESQKSKLESNQIENIINILQNFFSQTPENISSAKKLSKVLAIRTRNLNEILLYELQYQEENQKENRLFQLYSTFKNYVFNELSLHDFSDAFAQNLTYSLFIAKLNADTEIINLFNVKKFIPASFELIKELVAFLDELDNVEYKETKWIIEEILNILNNLNLPAILEELAFKSKNNKQNIQLNFTDPYIYFYEDFLAEYDKKLRKAKGVYYTPPAVVNFIIRSINTILKKDFNINEGIADKNQVTILDFATGTGTFLLEIMQQIFNNIPEQSFKIDNLIENHILKNIYGFEFLIAPYTIAHLKLSQFLKDLNYNFKSKERLQIFLTNTLEPIKKQIQIPFLPALTKETHLAQKIKDEHVLVITGNPPYSNYSTNKGEINKLLEEYKKNLDETKINLDDDYIKFIRFAQDKMDYSFIIDDKEKKKIPSNKCGIIGIITNNSFIGGITHRQMRKSLLDSFDAIYILNLRGYYTEKCEDGTKDENVFDIKQGVCISFFIKNDKIQNKGLYYAELSGSRENKYQFLFKNNFKDIDWKKLTLDNYYYFFKPFDYKGLKKYSKSFKINEIFEKYGSGVKTERDEITIHFDNATLLNVINDFIKLPTEEIQRKFKTKDSRDWTIIGAKNELLQHKKNINDKIVCINYRPFDIRKTFYTGKGKAFIGTPGYEINRHLLRSNYALTVKRQNKREPFSYAFIVNNITESCFFESSYANNSIFPLYLYDGEQRQHNYSSKFILFLKSIYKQEITTSQPFFYIYAILHSNIYRFKYAEFLKIDFPHIPFVEDFDMFTKLSKLGYELALVHLLKAFPEKNEDGEFFGRGNIKFEKCEIVEYNNYFRIFVNDVQYFDKVKPEVYEFEIGGYKVIEKLIKERKGIEITSVDLENITQAIRAVSFTIKQMKIIDKWVNSWI